MTVKELLHAAYNDETIITIDDNKKDTLISASVRNAIKHYGNRQVKWWDVEDDMLLLKLREN